MSVRFVDCRFVDNQWEGATGVSDRDSEPGTPMRCELDESAEAFFIQ